jgi:poly-gamma-glutamate synthesis protein (capsule biosynthesis protein)
MKKLHLVIIALLGTLLVILNIKYSHKKTIQQTDSLLTIKLNFVGDLMCHIPQFEYARIGKDSFDFKPYFEEIKKYLSDADATFGNLETVIGRSNIGFTGYPDRKSVV